MTILILLKNEDKLDPIPEMVLCGGFFFSTNGDYFYGTSFIGYEKSLRSLLSVPTQKYPLSPTTVPSHQL